MHAGEQLVDHLERSALPCGIAKLVEFCRHRIEHGPCFRKGRGTAGCENGQLALRRALRAAADRRIQIVSARGFELFRQPARHVGVHGCGGDEYRVLCERLGDAVLAEQNGFGLRGVDDHADDDICLACGLRRGLCATSAFRDEPRHGIGRDVAAGDIKTRAPQRRCHAKAHRPQPDDGDARF